MPVLPRIAPDREDDVREHEPDDGEAVAAVPDREPVEAHRALEERQAREQQHLDQCQVSGEERRQAPEPDQRGVEAVPVVAEAVGAARRPRTRRSPRRCRLATDCDATAIGRDAGSAPAVAGTTSARVGVSGGGGHVAPPLSRRGGGRGCAAACRRGRAAASCPCGAPPPSARCRSRLVLEAEGADACPGVRGRGGAGDGAADGSRRRGPAFEPRRLRTRQDGGGERDRQEERGTWPWFMRDLLEVDGAWLRRAP